MLRRRKLQSAAMASALLLLIAVALWSGATIVRRIIIAGARGGDDQTKTSFVGNHLRGGSGSVVATNTKEDLVWVHPDSQPFNDNSVASRANHLIIVAGHSVLISNDLVNAARDDSVWFLHPYQRRRGLPHAIVSHIRAGIALASKDERALLMFSGGETRAAAGPETEGGSYFRVADALGLWDGRNAVFAARREEEEEEEDGDYEGAAYDAAGKTHHRSSSSSSATATATSTTVRARTITEEYATDSFENLSFSICRFKEITGSYPTKISMVSFTFKRQRFETLHATALRWPLDRFDYVGVDPPPATGFDLRESLKGERENSFLPFRSDPYGCHSEALRKKRRERNPFARTAPYGLTCPEMRDLFEWCGPEIIEEGRVPWGGGRGSLAD